MTKEEYIAEAKKLSNLDLIREYGRAERQHKIGDDRMILDVIEKELLERMKH